ncbi:hypothetical protein AGMMS50249_6620 [candidate division SR1 bacterium]|nr:hypothetical protein AGMMS50249_6620 [candidate division SR1 bacterium]
MKKILKKVPLSKKEVDRTKAERLIRDLIFFAIGVIVTIFAYAIYDADASIVDEEMQLYTAQNEANQIRNQELFSGEAANPSFIDNSDLTRPNIEDLQGLMPTVDPITGTVTTTESSIVE